MIKLCSHVLSVACLSLLSMALLAQVSPAPDPDSENPFIGTWDLNAEDSDFGGATPPTRMSRTYADLGDGQYMYLVVQINEDGSLGGSSATYKYDGRRYPIANLNQVAAANISYRKINEHTVEYTVRLGEEVSQIGAKTISMDGNTLTIVIQYPDSSQGNQILMFNRR